MKRRQDGRDHTARHTDIVPTEKATDETCRPRYERLEPQGRTDRKPLRRLTAQTRRLDHHRTDTGFECEVELHGEVLPGQTVFIYLTYNGDTFIGYRLSLLYPAFAVATYRYSYVNNERLTFNAMTST